ncbi:MAG: L-sorbosone dehydrogenase [Gemmatimonadetes bacterium]|nr:L-sorbosone dehydrogenase [Gemmatimonadota bacterium]
MNKHALLQLFTLAMLGSVASLASCGSPASLPVSAGTGPAPELPAPEHKLIPVVHVAKAKGWPEGVTPTAAAGLAVNAFASGLDHPRWLYALPNGDVLVSETNGPPRPDDAKGIKGWFFKRFQMKAGAGVPSANRITLLRDADGDGVAELRTVFMDSLMSPFGIALVGSTLYVANSDALVRVPYETGVTHIGVTPVKVTDLPAGPLNHHWTKNVIASPDGHTLYVTVGSNSNAGENGIDKEEGRAAIWQVDAQTGAHSVMASGLRNPVGLAWQPESGQLWVSVNERDELGSDIVPDYMTHVTPGAFYGWPWSYYGQHEDSRPKPARPDMVARAIAPDYALGPHTASLGLAWSGGAALPASFTHGMFVGQHGSWNRKPFSGYAVVFVPFAGATPLGAPRDVLTGFLGAGGEARGRPVGVALDTRGALLVADDVGNTVWRVVGR